jgi:membrane-bound lytic murein transglycosylase F
MRSLIAARILSATLELVQNVHMWNLRRCLPAFLVSASLLLMSCGESLPPWREGRLRVIVPEISQGAEAEFERELSQLFIDSIHATAEFLPTPPEKIEAQLQGHHAHFAAASLRSGNSSEDNQFGPAYQTVREQVVCNREVELPRAVDALDETTIAVVAGSAQEKVLLEMRVKSPLLKWQSRHKTTVQALFQEVSDGTLDCLVANELQFANARNYHGNLVAAFNIGLPSKLAWELTADADPELLKQMSIFFGNIQKDGTLKRLIDRYYGHSDRLNSQDAATFIERSAKILPRYRHLFEEAATVTGEDWHLLAALAYQESQWDPLATSFTNVRGMMMLTEDTADRMKVKNRLDPRESIFAGAQYLVLIKEQMPERIPEPDRTWLALAAYNQGGGHLEDARVLTKRAGLNPDSWSDVKKWMPSLNQPGYYETLKYGYARGGEAVILVESIRSYCDMLKRLEPEKPAPAAEPAVSYSLLEPFKNLLHKKH